MRPEYRVEVNQEYGWWVATVYYGKRTVVGVTGRERTIALAREKGRSIIVAHQLPTGLAALKDQVAKEKLEMKAAQERIVAASKEIFTREAAALFITHPQLMSFTWTQYTPYFNDGDPCIFSVRHDPEGITLNGDMSGEDLHEHPNYEASKIARDVAIAGAVKSGHLAPRRGHFGYSQDDLKALGLPELDFTEQVTAGWEWAAPVFPAVGEFLAQFDASTMQHMFGDHVEVTVHRGGEVTTVEHDHD